MKPSALNPKSEASLKIVGSNTFGRNQKMSSEQTFNMMISDGWLVQTPGYKKVINLNGRNSGRGIFSSSQGRFMIAVIDNAVYKITGPSDNLNYSSIFTINTFFGDTSIDENIASQIAICDGESLWIYNYSSGVVTNADLPINPSTGNKILPGYVTYHDGYFIVPDKTSNAWYLSKQNDGTIWNWGASGSYVSGAIQSKPDHAQAVLRAPGRGNLIYVFGRNVVELWNDLGSQLFPYQRSTSASVDYGCLSSATIAAMDQYVAWLGINEKSGPVLMVSSGGGFTRLSNDGIDFKLADLVNPQKSHAFFYKIDGHVFYQITFSDPLDNYTLIYDFNTEAFFYLTNENMDYHIAESIAFFNSTYYFVSLNDGSLYELSSNYTTLDYSDPSNSSSNIAYEIPRMRVCNDLHQDDTSNFIANSLTFTLEQGVDPYYQIQKCRYISTEGGKVLSLEEQPGFIGKYITNEAVLQEYKPRVDLAISKDGGETYGSFISNFLNPLGNRKNKIIFWRLGIVNDCTIQLRFWSKYRVTVSDGVFQARTQ